MAFFLGCLLLFFQSAQAQRVFATRYANSATNGNIIIVGNVNWHCLKTSPATLTQQSNCTSAQAGGAITNNTVYMAPVDIDSDSTTANSSSATLSIPTGSEVLWAGLYWNGVSNNATRNMVLFSGPGFGYQSQTATVVDVVPTNNYQAFKDVTALVAAGKAGTYTVANVQSTTGPAYWGGWALVVAYKHSSLATRNLAVFDGLQSVSSSAGINISVSGFNTPAVGTVNSTIGVVSYDGDKGSNDGSATESGLKFGQTTSTLFNVNDAQNPNNDIYNSTISYLGSPVTTRNPNYPNTLGLDIDMFTPNTPLPNGATSAVVNVRSASETVYPGVITLATDIFVPNIKDSLTKTVTDVNGGKLLPEDELEYELVVKNTGNDGAINTILTDAIPTSTTYKSGSLSITSGANSGLKTDGSGDDQAEYDSVNKKVIFRLGTGATASAGGKVLPNEETRVRFRVTVNAGTASGTLISNSGVVNYNAQTLGTAISDTSDSDSSQNGDQPATITVTGADLSISKTHTGNLAIGVEGTFTIKVTNKTSSPAPSSGLVTVTDLLPSGANFSNVSISGTGWACTASPLQCTRSDALAVGASYPDIVLKATPNPASPGTWTNSATVSGGSEGSTTTADNTATDEFNVLGVDLTISKSHGGTLMVGQDADFTITVENVGGLGSSGTVTVTDTLPSNMTVVSFSGTGWACTVSPLQCTRSDALAVGSSYPTLTLRIKPQVGGTFTNTATVSGGGEVAAATSNNTVQDPYSVQWNVPNISLGKTVRNVTQGGSAGTSTQAYPGEVQEYCVSFQNTGGPAGNFKLADTLPSPLQPLPNAYGPGLGLSLALDGGPASLLTSASDADQGSYIGSAVLLNYGTLASSSGVLCFQGKVP